MYVFLKYAMMAFICVAFSTTNAVAQVRVAAQVDSSGDIYVGENFGYYIVIEGAENPGQVDLEPLREYQPRSTGNRQQSSTQIINNRMTTSKTIIMTYSLRVNSAGRIQLPPVTVTLDGKTYQTNPVDVNILKPGTTELLDLEMSLSETRSYVGQPVILTVNFYFSANIGDFQLDVPAFTSGDFELDDDDIVDSQAKEFQLNTGTRVFVKQYRVEHKSKDSMLVTFSKILLPKRAGTISVEPATVSADVAVGRARTRDSLFSSNIQYKRFMVSSEPVKLDVQDLPDQNRLDGFYGLIGRYTISSSAAPTQVSVGDPITVNISIGGSRYLKPVQWPALEQIPELAENFKIPSQKASPTIQNNAKIFTQTIRANNDRVTEIPSIPLVFLDPEKGEYITAKTEPIQLEVSPSKVLTNADLEGIEFAPVSTEVEAIRKGLSANYEGLDALEEQGFSPVVALIRPGYLVIWMSPLALLVLSAVAKFSTHKTPEKIAQKRRRGAAGKATGQLRKIASSAQQRHELLASIMKQYIGERFDRTAGALTSNDCFEIIADATKDTQSADRFRETIADCEAARYTSAESGIEQAQIEEVTELIRTIEKKSRK